MPVAAATSGTKHPIAPPRTPHTAGTRGASLVIRFLVELAMVSSLADWGASMAGPAPVRVALGVSAPLGALILWSRYLSPKARRRLAGPAALALEASLFSTASIGLAVTVNVALAAGFDVIAVANALLLRRLGRTGDPALTPAR